MANMNTFYNMVSVKALCRTFIEKCKNAKSTFEIRKRKEHVLLDLILFRIHCMEMGRGYNIAKQNIPPALSLCIYNSISPVEGISDIKKYKNIFAITYILEFPKQ